MDLSVVECLLGMWEAPGSVPAVEKKPSIWKQILIFICAKGANDSNICFPKEDTQMATKPMKRFPVSLLTGEMQMETPVAPSPHLLKQLSKINPNNFGPGCDVSGTLTWCLIQCYRYSGKVYRFLTNLDIHLSNHLAVSPLSPREDRCFSANVCTGSGYKSSKFRNSPSIFQQVNWISEL